MKNFVHREDPQNIDQLELVIARACSLIDANTCGKAIADFPTRVMALLDANGRHSEHGLKDFKTRMRLRRRECDYCEQVHDCECHDCDMSCLEAKLDRLAEPDEQDDEV